VERYSGLDFLVASGVQRGGGRVGEARHSEEVVAAPLTLEQMASAWLDVEG
jgi:hypothetical protein